MIHSVQVPFPVWCDHCKTTTERAFLITETSFGIIRLEHARCGQTIASMDQRELVQLPSIQRAEVAQELVRRANEKRPKWFPQSVLTEDEEVFHQACFGNARFLGDKSER